MLKEERFYKIIAFVKDKQQVSFSDVAEYLNISEGTARRDLNELEKRDIIRVVRGGVVWGKSDLARSKSDTRQIMNKDAKEKLVRNLGELVENGFAISINGGTTSIEAAKYITQNYSKMTVVTNSIDVVEIMKVREDFNLILTGGLYFRSENTIVGKQASEDMSLYNTDLAIISVSAISIEKGITDFRYEEIKVINTMIENARKKIVIADHSKFDKIDCMNICPLDKIDIIVTDPGIEPSILKKYGKNKINILI